MNLRPKLNEITVPLGKLLFDPNNPRFLEDHAVRTDEKDFADSDVQIQTRDRMRRESFHIDELRRSIETNGWQPVDRIFVRRIETLPGVYVVLEGNRRLVALREIGGEIAKAVDPLSVLEVVGTADLEESRAQITYLLGVRHHGSLKTWGPFAQAHNIYERYLLLGNMTGNTFKWDDEIAKTIANQLSINVKKIEERLRVYIAMKQLHEVPEIKKVVMEGKYYSLLKEALPPWGSNSLLKQYVAQDMSNFRLDDDSLRRLDAVCHFSVKDRENAPIGSPDEWRPLSKILKDADNEKRKAMLREVEEEKKPPSDVWANRQAELRQPRWDRWLNEVTQLLRRLQIGNIDNGDPRTQNVGNRLARILDSLPASNPGSSVITER